MNEENFLLEGRWVSSLPFDSDDYLMEYHITKRGADIQVSAKDLQDGEVMEISDVKWDGFILSFKSFMPSTQRVGFSQFRIISNGNIESKFTFTVLEELKRI